MHRSTIGALKYVTLTRPNISFAVNKVCQFMHQPTDVHWVAVKRILRYLKQTIDHGPQFNKSSSLRLAAFSDANWACCPDDRKPTCGFLIYLDPNLILWQSRKQPTVARSSTENEYRALAGAVAELTWLLSLLHELGVFFVKAPNLVIRKCRCSYFFANPVFHARTKHIEVDFHFVRYKVAKRLFEVRFISTKEQLADILTKGLSTNRFVYLHDKLNIHLWPSSLRGHVL